MICGLLRHNCCIHELTNAPCPSVLSFAAVNRVFVHNLPWSVTDEALQEFMSRAGTVRTCTIMRMRDNRSKVSTAITRYLAGVSADRARLAPFWCLQARNIRANSFRTAAALGGLRKSFYAHICACSGIPRQLSIGSWAHLAHHFVLHALLSNLQGCA